MSYYKASICNKLTITLKEVLLISNKTYLCLYKRPFIYEEYFSYNLDLMLLHIMPSAN